MVKGINTIINSLSAAARKSKYVSQCTKPMKLTHQQLQMLNGTTGNLDTFASVSHKGRSSAEQIQHLTQNWTEKVFSRGHFEKADRTCDEFKSAKLFTKSGSKNRYLMVNGELYFIPNGSEKQRALNFVDNIYNKYLGQSKKGVKGALGFRFEKGSEFTAYKYIEPDASIKDYPNLLKDGFGLDCLFSTPISESSVIVKNGQAIRLQNGLCKYVGQSSGGIKVPELMTFQVKISEYFDSASDSYELVKDFTEKDIKEALKKLAKISDDELKIGHSGTYVMTDYKRIEEQLLLRKEYLAKYLEKMELHPKKGPELMSEYLERIEGYLPKYKDYTMPLDDFVLRTEPDKLLRKIEDNWQVYRRVERMSFPNTADEFLVDGTLTHNASLGTKTSPLEYLESILDKGLTTGQATLCKMPEGSGAGGNYTSTPGMLDTFIVKGRQSIGDYFNPANRHIYEYDFMKVPQKACFTIDKTRLDNFQVQHYPRPDLKLDTHYTIPFGVPTSCIDRMIITPNMPQNQVDDIIKLLDSKGLDIKLYDRTGKLLWQPVKKVVDVMKNYKFELYGKQGLPLKYSREQFRNDVWNMISREVPVSQRTEFLSRFNLTAGQNGVLDGIPVLKGFVPKTNAERKMVALIEKFYQNETVITGNPHAKAVLDNVLKKHPEFAMMIGKAQHGTHIYSVDVHSLEVLKKSLNNPIYESLSDDGKEILEYVAIMHDYGKKGLEITPGHAALSKDFAKGVLASCDNLSDQTKKRIINIIANHHWFEGYNKGYLSSEDFAKLFPTLEDKKIAMILARADFESVSSTFHLGKLVKGRYLTNEQYETTIEGMMDKLLKISSKS